jgi:hypothetical protein
MECLRKRLRIFSLNSVSIFFGVTDIMDNFTCRQNAKLTIYSQILKLTKKLIDVWPRKLSPSVKS